MPSYRFDSTLPAQRAEHAEHAARLILVRGCPQCSRIGVRLGMTTAPEKSRREFGPSVLQKSRR